MISAQLAAVALATTEQPDPAADGIAWVFAGIAVVVAVIIAIGFIAVMRRGLKRDR
jgi:hypothetical protein